MAFILPSILTAESKINFLSESLVSMVLIVASFALTVFGKLIFPVTFRHPSIPKISPLKEISSTNRLLFIDKSSSTII